MTTAAALRNRKLARGSGVLVVFAVLGPAIGGLALFAVLAAARSMDPNAAALEGLGSVLTFSLAAGFAFGGVQAIATGAYVGFKTIRHGRFSWVAVVLASAAASLIYAAFLASPLGPFDGSADNRLGAAKITLWLTPIAVMCAIVCRLICGGLGLIAWRDAPPPGQPSG